VVIQGPVDTVVRLTTNVSAAEPDRQRKERGVTSRYLVQRHEQSSRSRRASRTTTRADRSCLASGTAAEQNGDNQNQHTDELVG
jgi:hypothetical protein